MNAPFNVSCGDVFVMFSVPLLCRLRVALLFMVNVPVIVSTTLFGKRRSDVPLTLRLLTCDTAPPVAFLMVTFALLSVRL